MGDWCTVTIVGTIEPKDAPAARAFINTGEDWDRFHCLCNCGPSMCGLGDWMPRNGGDFTAVGNLSERNYDAESVAETLQQLLAVAPSLKIKVHCGGPYESTDCVATVTAADGEVYVSDPEIETVGVGMDAAVAKNTIQLLLGLRR